MKQKIAFVINPNSGVKKKLDVGSFIQSNFPGSVPFDILVWADKNNFNEIQLQIANGSYTTVVACGGDGTVNQVASCLINTNMALGILPLGSGNGLARSLGIPLDFKKALHLIEKNVVSVIDSATINKIPFFCTAGIGFDAHIAHQFASSTTRGFMTYFITSVKSFFKYRANQYEVSVDGIKIKESAFLITIANAPQWGNDVFIAPEAILNDGLLHISIIKNFNVFSIPALAIKLLTKNIHRFSLFSGNKGTEVMISFSGSLPVHYDGEPIMAKENITIKILPQSLRVISI